MGRVNDYGVVTVSKPCANVIVLGKDVSGRITIAFQYNPQLVEKAKTISGRKWHKDKKYCQGKMIMSGYRAHKLSG
jgi:hypothetical protein